MKKSILIIASIFYTVFIIAFIRSNIENKGILNKTGFEKNQALMREEYFKREIPRLYFRKIGYLYLTDARYYLNKLDQELADVFSLKQFPVLVVGVYLFALLI